MEMVVGITKYEGPEKPCSNCDQLGSDGVTITYKKYSKLISLDEQPPKAWWIQRRCIKCFGKQNYAIYEKAWARKTAIRS